MTSKQKGFTLIEVMISFLLIAFGVLGLAKLQAYMEQKAEFAASSLSALHKAEAKLESFRTRSLNGASSGAGTIKFVDIVDGADTANGLTWSVTSPSSALSTSVKSIKVVAKWSDRTKIEHSIELETMISKYSEFDTH
ncbi:hypothetical protein ATY35_12785 [Vibrio cidicii]|uniref:Type IV pilin n=1 Tax=Vibrio cidicii TaxID=1763883 RepID=A0A151JKC6_9VIBR|nr:prepilin-type N-terminal cleavage/methylation domain-containing protein [Vibrio cidicii]KYN25983.1 hypothetical protein AUQ44_12040 [Vibrio cidicii]KYN86998.1 hypothetical protein ATY35_12785 [Vibrio cidicii]